MQKPGSLQLIQWFTGMLPKVELAMTGNTEVPPSVCKAIVFAMLLQCNNDSIYEEAQFHILSCKTEVFDLSQNCLAKPVATRSLWDSWKGSSGILLNWEPSSLFLLVCLLSA